MKRSATVLFLSLLLAGSVLALAFAPLSLWPLAILSPAYLLWVWQHPRLTPSPRQALQWGIAYGLGLYGLGVSWVFISIHRYGNTDPPLAALLTGIFILVFALLTGLQGYLLKRFYRGNHLGFCLLGFPCLWVLFEWLRSVFLSGFPWLFLGYTQLTTALSGFAPIGSVYAVSLAVAFSAGVLIVLLHSSTRIKIMVSLGIISLWGGGYLLRTLTWTTPHLQETTISLVQANIEPSDKFIQQDPIQAVKRSYEKLSERHWGNHLILWPENAIAYPLPYVNPYLTQLKNRAQARHTTLITGLQSLLPHTGEYYNSMIAVGNGRGIYHKRHLVPFGEYLPIEALRGIINFFDIPMSNFIPGPKEQSLLQAGDLKLAPLMCYEIAFPELVRETVKDADFLITLSEDGWFGDSWGPHQHLEIARMRALEMGRPLLRATTCGISAIIDANGQLVARSPQFQALVLQGSAKGRQGETPWQQIGLWPWLIFCLIGFLAQPWLFRPLLLRAKSKLAPAPSQFLE